MEISLNPIPGGGGLLAPSPLRFFLCHCQTPEDRKLILADFFQTFIAHILTKKLPGQVRSGYQRWFVDPTSEKFAIPPELEFFTDKFPLFRFSSGYHHAQFVYFRICISATWGQVRFVIFTSQAYGKILKCALLRVNESKPPNSFRIMTDYLICDDPGVIYWQGHRERSSEVMWGHQ